MSRKFAWCLADQHAKPDGSGCPGVIGGADGLHCDCPCHRDIALQVRGNEASAWDNGSHNKAAPAVRQHRDPGASPTIKESTDG